MKKLRVRVACNIGSSREKKNQHGESGVSRGSFVTSLMMGV